LSNGEVLDVDMVLVGIGAAPATGFLSRTQNGIETDKFGGIVCDPFL
jgi:pyruvate/2-oxoglutarate dehydrogenase complex dihydrolipoamide dehydrogenase (E3) component